MSDTNKVEVEIFNQKFTLVSAKEGEKRLKQLANFVDGKMKEVYEATKISAGLKIAILTALNLADELWSLKESKQSAPTGDSPAMVQRILNIVERMEDIMAGSKD